VYFRVFPRGKLTGGLQHRAEEYEAINHFERKSMVWCLAYKEALFATQQKRPDEFNHLTLLL
tara:strand:+ start:370 stop:555 length:186 start_codon:yes stop_codon:yes gene_type:complete